MRLVRHIARRQARYDPRLTFSDSLARSFIQSARDSPSDTRNHYRRAGISLSDRTRRLEKVAEFDPGDPSQRD